MMNDDAAVHSAQLDVYFLDISGYFWMLLVFNLAPVTIV
jgi:hypothetical protein